MTVYSYIVARDYGFAPNPFGTYCTLATCKPKIRRKAEIGDWILGTGAKANGLQQKLVFALKVQEKLSFDEYWKDTRFQYKKPCMNGSLVQMYGDNIYYLDEVTAIWNQEDSHHSYVNGQLNNDNLKKDISGAFVLVSTHFYYFGRDAAVIPTIYEHDVCAPTQGHIIVPEAKSIGFVDWLESNFKPGRHADPYKFGGKFERFKG